jgi:phosphatidylserine/phosphatidylglycerophosphate/cardiolipin synthase-like enzyme
VFSLPFSLAVAALSPVLQAASVTSGAAIAVCFSPEEDCAAFAIREIDNAEREILVGAYGLTTGSGIVEALVRARGRGVYVRLITDRTTPCGNTSGIGPLTAVGIPIWIDIQARIAHGKTMVIDEAVTLTGSYQLDPRRRCKLGKSQPRLVPGCRSGLRSPLAGAPRSVRSI